MVTHFIFDFYNVLIFPKSRALSYISTLINQNQNINQHFIFNHQLLNFLAKIKTKCHLYILSNSSSLLEHAQIKNELEPIFIKIFKAGEMNLSKDNAKSFLYLANLINIPPQKICFVDDQYSNIQAASAAGLQTIHFQSTSLTIKQIKKIDLSDKITS